MKTDFKSIEWTNKLTMPDGIDNPEWDNIAELVASCNDLAYKLHERLEELSKAMFLNDCTLTVQDVDGDEELLDRCDVQDLADNAEEIMTATDLIYE